MTWTPHRKSDHRSEQVVTPTNHLNGTGLHVDMLEALNDHDLAEQIAYYQQGADESTSGRGQWGWGKMLSTARGVQERRHVTSS